MKKKSTIIPSKSNFPSLLNNEIQPIQSNENPSQKNFHQLNTNEPFQINNLKERYRSVDNSELMNK